MAAHRGVGRCRLPRHGRRSAGCASRLRRFTRVPGSAEPPAALGEAGGDRVGGGGGLGPLGSTGGVARSGASRPGRGGGGHDAAGASVAIAGGDRCTWPKRPWCDVLEIQHCARLRGLCRDLARVDRCAARRDPRVSRGSRHLRRRDPMPTGQRGRSASRTSRGGAADQRRAGARRLGPRPRHLRCRHRSHDLGDLAVLHPARCVRRPGSTRVRARLRQWRGSHGYPRRCHGHRDGGRHGADDPAHGRSKHMAAGRQDWCPRAERHASTCC